MGMTKDDHKYMENTEGLIDYNINNIVAEQIKEIVTGDYHTIKQGDKECRLFKSLANRRLVESGETFDEYKLRLKINAKMIKEQKKGIYESSTHNV